MLYLIGRESASEVFDEAWAWANGHVGWKWGLYPSQAHDKGTKVSCGRQGDTFFLII